MFFFVSLHFSQYHWIRWWSSYSFCLYFIRKFHNSYDLTGDEVKLSWLCSRIHFVFYLFLFSSIISTSHNHSVHYFWPFLCLCLYLFSASLCWLHHRRAKSASEWKSVPFYSKWMTKNVEEIIIIKFLVSDKIKFICWLFYNDSFTPHVFHPTFSSSLTSSTAYGWIHSFLFKIFRHFHLAQPF